MKFIITLTSLLFTFAAHAGDTYMFRSLGFSKDTKKYAFLQHVTQDGSGFPVARVTVMDIAANKVIAETAVVLEDEGKIEQDAIDEALKKAKLSKHGIDARYTGRTLLNRVEGDRSSYTDSKFATGYFRTYELKTGATEVAIAADSYCIVEPQLVKLTLTNENPSVPLNEVLLEETALHKDRPCAYNHSVSKVIYTPRGLVVILAYKSVGFEGPNTEFVAVTKNIELE